jgi:hypothetical protein
MQILFFLILIINGDALLIPPKFDIIGCNGKINITSNIECNKFISGYAIPNSTITIYSHNYLEKGGVISNKPTEYVNIGSLQKGYGFQFNLNNLPGYYYGNPSIYLNTCNYNAEIINGTVQTTMFLTDEQKLFLSSDIIELYRVLSGCFIATKANGDIIFFGCCNYQTNIPFNNNYIQIETSETGVIILDSAGKIINAGPYKIYGDNIKKVYAGGLSNYVTLSNTGKLYIYYVKQQLPYIFYQFYDISFVPQHMLFTESGGAFLNPNNTITSWGNAEFTIHNFPKVIQMSLQVDNNGYWQYILSNDEINNLLYQDARHLSIQNHYNNVDSGVVYATDVFNYNIVFENLIPSPQITFFQSNINTKKLRKPQFMGIVSKTIKGTGIPDSDITLYSIGLKFFNSLGPVQSGSTLLANAYIEEGRVYASGDSMYGGDIGAVLSLLYTDVIELYVINNGAFVALKRFGDVVSWGSESCGGGKYLHNIVQIATSTCGFITLNSTGQIQIYGYFENSYTMPQENFIQVYAGGDNIFAAKTIYNSIYIWGNTEYSGQVFNDIVGGYIVLTGFQCGVVYENNTVINFGNQDNHLNEQYVPYLISNNIRVDSIGDWSYTMTTMDINNYIMRGSKYFAITSKKGYFISQMSYTSEQYIL